MSVIHAPESSRIGIRHVVFGSVLITGLALLLLRLWYLQVVESDQLRARAEAVAVTRAEKLAPRGTIVDKHGRLLAGVRPELILTAKPGIVRKNPDTIQRLARMLNVPAKKLEQKLDDAKWRPFVPSAIYVGVPIDVATKLSERAEEFPGWTVESQPMRYYPEATSLAHVLGYVWTPSDRDVKRLEEKGVEPAPYVGKIGLESAFELDLMGKPGFEEVQVDARRRPLRIRNQSAATAGDKLVLSIDAKTQKICNELLAGRRGAIVVLDTTSGGVLAMATAPTYDASLFLGGIGSDEWASLRDDPAKPMLHRAIRSSYAPGSTFKIVTAMAAAMQGKFSPYRTAYCAGAYKVGNRQFRCLGRHGAVAFDTAFVKSCNVYFSDLAVSAGPDALREACLAAGLGQPPGIDIGGDGRGVVPTQEWLRQWQKDPTKPVPWYTGDTVNFGIGQGYLETTPLQMACLAMLVANKGISYRPHVVTARVLQGPNPTKQFVQPEIMHRVDLPDTFWTSLQRAMLNTVELGTAKRGAIPGLAWGGKTGSAENRKDRLTHSWFVGIAPVAEPQIAICVLIENAGHGGDIAVPVAAQVVRSILRPERSPVVEIQPGVSRASSPAALRAKATPSGSSAVE